jgi:hypothetical protein
MAIRGASLVLDGTTTAGRRGVRSRGHAAQEGVLPEVVTRVLDELHKGDEGG